MLIKNWRAIVLKTGIIGSFSLSALILVLSFLTREDGGYMSVLLLFFGIAMAIAGVALAARNRNPEQK